MKKSYKERDKTKSALYIFFSLYAEAKANPAAKARRLELPNVRILIFL